MEAPDFWDNPEKSQESMKNLKSMKDDIAIYAKLKDEFDEDRNSDRDGSRGKR